jgi:predicted acetyltransferase
MEIQEHREQFINELPFSQDIDNEENIGESKCYKININTVCVGYCCIDSQKTLWQFYLIQSAVIYSQKVFKFLIDMNYIVAAECLTYDHLLMSLCLDFHKKANCSGYIFRDDANMQCQINSCGNIKYRIATKEDYNQLSEIDSITPNLAFFYNLDDSIHNKEVFIFFSDEEIIGAGTCKKVWNSKNYYDIGMVVAKKHRHKGIGTYIIKRLKEYCYDRNYVPICGCAYSNIASKKTLERAGFIAKHRGVRFEFY